ncbi:hypothetical protein PMZ80_009392 [Knufia obscura]|uniref:Uncharacterized protein n=2 Tax=Knufia TaxID=430999 RepID=A0AAN8I9P4_9EURO|nr:hypothetical protein PMZ80_009392 [Knufia obscura]KAK5955851.1 hypothetical protein OHC33_003492 [Knufia fluminis]
MPSFTQTQAEDLPKIKFPTEAVARFYNMSQIPAPSPGHDTTGSSQVRTCDIGPTWRSLHQHHGTESLNSRPQIGVPVKLRPAPAGARVNPLSLQTHWANEPISLPIKQHQETAPLDPQSPISVPVKIRPAPTPARRPDTQIRTTQAQRPRPNHVNHSTTKSHPRQTSFTTFCQSLHQRRLARQNQNLSHSNDHNHKNNHNPRPLICNTLTASPLPISPHSPQIHIPSLKPSSITSSPPRVSSSSAGSQPPPPPPTSSSTPSRGRARSSTPYTFTPTPLPNQPTCTCHTPTCPLHNGTWEFFIRRGYDLLLDRIQSQRAAYTGEVDIELDIEGMTERDIREMGVKMPTVQDIVGRVREEGWNLGSETWRWG